MTGLLGDRVKTVRLMGPATSQPAQKEGEKAQEASAAELVPARSELHIYGAMAGDARRISETLRDLPHRGKSIHSDLMVLREAVQRLLAATEELMDRMGMETVEK